LYEATVMAGEGIVSSIAWERRCSERQDCLSQERGVYTV
jgi:hypothetical protein